MNPAPVDPAIAPYFTPVAQEHAYRLLNHGPTVLVSSRHAGVDNVMAAAWSMPLDFNPPTVAVVIDKSTRTRGLVEASGRFALNLPPRALAALTLAVGTTSARDDPRKLERCGVTTFEVAGHSLPLVAGCVGWLVCDVIAEPHIEQAYDLFIGRVAAAWADERVFAQGRWRFENAPESLRTLHHVAGGHFYAIGEAIDA